jgi:hypothetical protein
VKIQRKKDGSLFLHSCTCGVKITDAAGRVGEISPLDVPVVPVVGCVTDFILRVVNIVIGGVDEFNAGIGSQSSLVVSACPLAQFPRFLPSLQV